MILSGLVMGAAVLVGTADSGSESRAFRVIDGDTFVIVATGERIRIANIDAPETHPCRCPRECRLGPIATARLDWLLSAPAVTIARSGRDRFGRSLARVSAGGEDVGELLVAAGNAAPWRGHRHSWCK